MSSSSFLLLKMLIVFLLFCLSKASGGSCLSYGHSCWGGHGKRSGTVHMAEPFQKHTTGWYISKMLDPPARDSKNIEDIFNNQNPDLDEINTFRRGEYQPHTESDLEKNIVGKRDKLETNSEQNKWRSENDETEEEVMILTPAVQNVPFSKLRFYQIMNQENSNPKREY